MREVIRKVDGHPAATATLTLSFDERSKSRQRARLDDGEEVALLLPRGTVLRGGDRLLTSDGQVIEVRAADETLSSVEPEDTLQLARAAYHLGNRHVPLEVARGHLRYQHDHVLDEMVHALGLTVRVVQAPFEPEAGAYGGGHGHGHTHHHEGHHHAHHDHAHPGDHPHGRKHG